MNRALQEALVTTPERRDEASAKKIMKKSGSKCLEPLKETIAMARKSKMRTVEQYLCDQCDNIIPKSKNNKVEGVIVQGNIYVADPTTRAGLIGNNIPEVAGEDGRISPDSIRQTVLCVQCFLKGIGLVPSTTREKKPKKQLDQSEAILSEVRGMLAGSPRGNWRSSSESQRTLLGGDDSVGEDEAPSQESTYRGVLGGLNESRRSREPGPLTHLSEDSDSYLA
jgi:hypothetical protein